MRTKRFSAMGLMLLATLTAGVLGADKPRMPAAPKPSPPAEGHRQLADGAIDFVAPPEWQEATKSNTPTRNSFVSQAHDAMIAVEVLSMDIKSDMAEAMCTKMRQTRKANGQKFVQEPTIEKDDHFIIRIRERYEIKGKTPDLDKVADQLHLYRQVGPKVVLVTINSLGGEEKAKEHHAAGESASMSAEYTKGAGKAPAK